MQPQIQPPVEPVSEAPAKPKVKIIDSIPAFLAAVVALGPFALPLLWRNPRFKWTTKLWASVAVLVFTYFLSLAFGKYMKGQWEQAQQMMEQMRALKEQGY